MNNRDLIYEPVSNADITTSLLRFEFDPVYIGPGRNILFEFYEQETGNAILKYRWELSLFATFEGDIDWASLKEVTDCFGKFKHYAFECGRTNHAFVHSRTFQYNERFTHI